MPQNLSTTEIYYSSKNQKYNPTKFHLTINKRYEIEDRVKNKSLHKITFDNKNNDWLMENDLGKH